MDLGFRLEGLGFTYGLGVKGLGHRLGLLHW